MKTNIASSLLAASLLLLTSCEQMKQQWAVKATPVVPQGHIQHGNRYTATWGDPEVVNWVDNLNGHRWTCSYADFFKYCGKNHPSVMSITVKGKLPANIAHPAANPQPGAVASTPAPIDLIEPGEPAPYQVPQ